MPEYSMAIDTGSEHYMTTISAPDAQAAIRDCVRRVDWDAESARVEILEVLTSDQGGRER